MFDAQRIRLLSVLDAAHTEYHKNEIFDGPSFCFHIKSLDAARMRDFERFAECSYAMLVSWGMHRMGRGGPKMCEFDEYRAGLNGVWPIALSLQDIRPEALMEGDWIRLETIFRGLRCMVTDTQFVANSKVMAHLLPNLVAPVDREYGLTFLFQSKNIPYGIDREWKKLKDVLQWFFYPIAQDSLFRAKADEWLASRDRFRWDTSALKIIDNVVIGIAWLRRGKQEQEPEKAQAAPT